MTGRELLAALDEELDRLPPRYREPLVLCYLEGLTRDEAATRLGVPPATLKTRLDRGRKRLGDALTKRGVALGRACWPWRSPPRRGRPRRDWSSAILAAASGHAPDAVAELARGVAVNGLIKKSAFIAARQPSGRSSRAWAWRPPRRRRPGRPRTKPNRPTSNRMPVRPPRERHGHLQRPRPRAGRQARRRGEAVPDAAGGYLN